MKQFQIGQRGVTQLHLLTVVAVLILGAFAITKHFSPPPVSAQTSRLARTNNLANLVRGYLAVSVGRSARVESTGGLFSRQLEARDVYLPGVEVYLEDPQTGKVSKPVSTDLSGRFSLYVPQAGRYRLCWQSKVYDNGCTAPYISAGSSAQFLSTVNIRLPVRKGYVAITGNVTNADGSSARTFEPLLNINAFATVNMTSAQGDQADVYVNNFGDYLLPYVPSDRQNPWKLSVRRTN